MKKQTLSYLFTLMLTSSASVVFAASKSNSEVNRDIDQLTETWLQTERATQRLNTNWQLEKQLLTQRIAILKAQNKQLSTSLKQSNSQADALTSRRQSLLLTQGEIEQSLAQYKAVLPKFIHALQMKVASAPPHMQQQLQDSLDQLSENQPLSGQYQVAVDTLKQWHKNDKLMQVKQGLIIVDGTSIMTEQLYLGNDQAWFSTPDNRRVGVGFSTAQGWQWLELTEQTLSTWQNIGNGSFKQGVASAIKDAKHLTPGRLIPLPVRIGDQQ